VTRRAAVAGGHGFGLGDAVENTFDQIARVDRTTGKIDEFPLNVKDPVARKLGADWDGNLWVGLHGAGELLRVDYKTLKMTEFTLRAACG
jgi:streptogramin lyase